MNDRYEDKGAPADAGLDTEFHRGLGLFDATMVVVGSMIGSGIFIVPATMAREIGSPGWLLVAWLLTGALTDQRRPVLRRAGRDDAAGRRTVSLPARGVLAAVRLSLRLDAVPRHPDRIHRGGRRRLRTLRRRAVAGHLRGEISAGSVAPDARLCRVAVHGPTRRRDHDRRADGDEHLRPALRQARAEPVHRHQDGGAVGTDRRRAGARLERGGGRRRTSATCGRCAAARISAAG